MAGRAVEPLEGDFEHEAFVLSMRDFAHGAKPIQGVIADIAVEFDKFGVGEAEIGFADRNEPQQPS